VLLYCFGRPCHVVHCTLNSLPTALSYKEQKKPQRDVQLKLFMLYTQGLAERSFSFGRQYNKDNVRLKGRGNEADFLGFLQKLVPLESLTLPFEPIRFWLRIRGDIRI
jgi:hypothetical protein